MKNERNFAIVDNEGRYVSKHSIMYIKEENKWSYLSHENYYGILLRNSREQAEKDKEELEKKLKYINKEIVLNIIEVE